MVENKCVEAEEAAAAAVGRKICDRWRMLFAAAAALVERLVLPPPTLATWEAARRAERILPNMVVVLYWLYFTDQTVGYWINARKDLQLQVSGLVDLMALPSFAGCFWEDLFSQHRPSGTHVTVVL